jgi:4-amino-4-deoxy-L-arabinose transferase-like glycosyltransferase
MIYTLEVGKGVRVVKLVAFFLLLAALTVAYDLHCFKDFGNAEAMQTAEVARNLARGQGFTTQCVQPFALHLVETKLGAAPKLGAEFQPNLVNPPLYPLLLAGLMKVLPFDYDVAPAFWIYQPEMLIALCNQALFFLAVWLSFRLARRLFDKAVAWVTAIVLLGTEVLWRFTVSGLPTLLSLVIFVGLLWCLVVLEEGGRAGNRSRGWFVRWALLTGLLLGLGALTRYACAWLALPALLFFALFLEQRRGWVCGVTLLAFLVVFTPWLARNYSVSGTLFGLRSYVLQQDTPRLADARLERSFNPDLSPIEPHDYLRKFLGNLGDEIRNDLPRLGGGWVAAFFLPALFMTFRSPALNRLRWFILWSTVLLAVVQACGRTHLSNDSPLLNGENLLVLLTPAVFLFGVGIYYVLLAQRKFDIPELVTVFATIFVVVASLPLIFAFLPPRGYPIMYPPYYAPWIQESARLFRTNEVLVSDAPWAVAWYGDRQCVWTPLHVGDVTKSPPVTAESFYTINDERKVVSGVLLTPLTTNARFLKEILQGNDYYAWSRFAVEVLLHSKLPDKFPLRYCRKRYLLVGMVILADRERWNEAEPSAPNPEETPAGQRPGAQPTERQPEPTEIRPGVQRLQPLRR